MLAADEINNNALNTNDIISRVVTNSSFYIKRPAAVECVYSISLITHVLIVCSFSNLIMTSRNVETFGFVNTSYIVSQYYQNIASAKLFHAKTSEWADKIMHILFF